MKQYLKTRTLLNWFGLLGIVSFLSYLAAVIFAPLAYPGYDWLSQAVSDLSAESAPSLSLWNALSAFYSAFNLLTMALAVIAANQSQHNRVLKLGIYIYAAMNLVSEVGYRMFPLTEAGNTANFQNIMHVYVVTVSVVLLSIAGLLLCIIGGAKKKGDKLLFIGAIICLTCMMVGALVSNIVPKAIFGLFERFSTLSATAYVALIGIWVFRLPLGEKRSAN